MVKAAAAPPGPSKKKRTVAKECSLTQLTITYSRIGDAGAAALADALKLQESAALVCLVTVCCETRISWKEKTISIKKFGGTPLFDRNHPVDQSRLSRGSVPFVLRKFCPIYVELHISQIGTSRMSRDSPPNRPRDTSEAYRPPNSFTRYTCSFFIGSLLPMKTLQIGNEMTFAFLINYLYFRLSSRVSTAPLLLVYFSRAANYELHDLYLSLFIPQELKM